MVQTNETPTMEKFLETEFEKMRESKGWRYSQAQWSKYLGVSHQSLNQWMNGLRLPTGSNVFALAAKLGPQVYDILGQPRRVSDNPRIQRLNEIYPTLCKEKQKEIDDIIDSAPEGDTATAHAQAQ